MIEYDLEIDLPTGAPARMETPSPGNPQLARLALNQWTVKSLSTRETIELCARSGVPAVGLWRDETKELGIADTVRLLDGLGVRASSLCRSGFVAPADSAAEWKRALDDNRAAIDEAAALGTEVLVFVAGGLADGSKDLAGARGRVADALEALAPYAQENGVRIAIEPLHPMYCADRAVISTLGQALELVKPFPETAVGVVVDTFHVWWDPQILETIAEAFGRIVAFQVCDWITPLPQDVLLARGMMGDGHIDFASLTRAVTAAGYSGDVEVEIFNHAVWESDPARIVRTTMRRYVELIAPHL